MKNGVPYWIFDMAFGWRAVGDKNLEKRIVIAVSVFYSPVYEAHVKSS